MLLLVKKIAVYLRSRFFSNNHFKASEVIIKTIYYCEWRIQDNSGNVGIKFSEC